MTLVWKDFRIAVNGKVIDPSTPIPAGTTITVLATLWNEGDAPVGVNVYLTIDGRKVKSMGTSAMPPKSYFPIKLDITLYKRGSHTICLGYRGPSQSERCITVTVTEPSQPLLIWTDFKIIFSGKVLDTSRPLLVGSRIWVRGNLWNEGNVTANVTVYLTINGREVKSARVTIPPKSYIPFEWDVRLTEKGSNIVCLDYR